MLSKIVWPTRTQSNSCYYLSLNHGALLREWVRCPDSSCAVYDEWSADEESESEDGGIDDGRAAAREPSAPRKGSAKGSIPC